MTPRMIVVTGGAGFIGSNIVARLTAETAYDVVVCDRLETADLALCVLDRSRPFQPEQAEQVAAAVEKIETVENAQELMVLLSTDGRGRN